jgi:hypothetical protein
MGYTIRENALRRSLTRYILHYTFIYTYYTFISFTPDGKVIPPYLGDYSLVGGNDAHHVKVKWVLRWDWPRIM